MPRFRRAGVSLGPQNLSRRDVKTDTGWRLVARVLTEGAFFERLRRLRAPVVAQSLGSRVFQPHINLMLKFAPIFMAILYGLVMYRVSLWRTKSELDAKSTELVDPGLKRLTDQMAASLDLPRIKVHLYEIEPVNGLAAPDGRI
ncbi:MAG: hypothetical protein AAF718_02125, partial [Pseudomonadota bacterium]